MTTPANAILMASQTSNWELPLLVTVAVVALCIFAYQWLNNRDRRQNLEEPTSDLSRVSGLKLKWQVGVVSELRAGSELLASLVFEGFAIRSQMLVQPNPATGKALDRCWNFTAEAFVDRISINNCGDGPKVGDFAFTRAADGSLTLVDERCFDFMKADSGKHEFRTSTGLTLVSFTLDDIWLGKSFAVDIDPEFASTPELALLLILGCYILAIKVTDPFIP